ncbi:MAG: Gfo/Idh/MocA family protein [Thermomicrobiales bacterium]
MGTPSYPIRFAFVGAGGVSRLHVPAFQAAPECVRLAAVCDARPDAARALAEQFPAPVRLFGDHRDLLDTAEIDAAIIGLPHNLHFPVARDLVAGGVPVLVEKPLTCTLDETRELRELAARHRVPVVAGQMRRFNREAIWLRRWLDADPEHFGDLSSFAIHSWQHIVAYLNEVKPADPWLLDGKRAGGGVVISLAIHQLDLLRFLSGHDYTEVHARGRFDPPFINGAESSAAVLLQMNNGAAGMLHANYLGPRVPYSEAVYLYGSHGTIIQHAGEIGQYHGPFRYATIKGRETTAWVDQYQNLDLVPAEEAADLHENPFVNQLVHFATALHTGTMPRNNVDENFNTMACIQAINDSLRSGKPESVAME